MPTISERQSLIRTVLLTGEEDLFKYLRAELINEIDLPSPTSSESSDSSPSSNVSSESSLSSSESESSESSESQSSDSESGEQTDEDTRTTTSISDLLGVIMETRVVNPHEVSKNSQLDLVLVEFKTDDVKRFRQNLRVAPRTFDSLLNKIENHPVFSNNSYTSQIPVCEQLAITLFRLGHDGNAASVAAVAQWAGVSSGAVVKCTRRVMVSFLALHDAVIHWPTEEQKEGAKAWVESVSCAEWRNGYCMVDGTLVPLSQKPGHHGEAYFDRKSNYSLNVQVISMYIGQLQVSNVF